MESEKTLTPEDIDLFGRPLEPIRDRRGRKSYKKDKENQAFVSRRVADGWSQASIAEDMGIDEKTLRKYFSRELTNGAIYVRGEMLDLLHRKAREGHVPSIKTVLERSENAAPKAPRRQAKEDEADAEDEKTPVQLGKKEQRDLDAQDVPPDFGDVFDRLRRPH